MTVIKENSKVKVHYIGKLTDGTLFDSSKSIEGTQFNNDKPLEVELGKGLLIPGFESGLQGMAVGETKTVTIPCSDAYGEPKETHIQEVEKKYVPDTVQVGQVLQTETKDGVITVKVAEVREDVVLLDANHPLAGEDLIFELEVVSID